MRDLMAKKTIRLMLMLRKKSTIQTAIRPFSFQPATLYDILSKAIKRFYVYAVELSNANKR
jgi:hypothetical protein